MTRQTKTEKRWGVIRHGELWFDFGFPKEPPDNFVDFSPARGDIAVRVTLIYTRPTQEGTR